MLPVGNTLFKNTIQTGNKGPFTDVAKQKMEIKEQQEHLDTSILSYGA